MSAAPAAASASARVARAEPDGYTMIIGNWTSLVGTPAVYPLPFDVQNDFAPVALLSFSPLMLVGRKISTGEQRARS